MAEPGDGDPFRSAAAACTSSSHPLVWCLSDFIASAPGSGQQQHPGWPAGTAAVCGDVSPLARRVDSNGPGSASRRSPH